MDEDPLREVLAGWRLDDVLGRTLLDEGRGKRKLLLGREYCRTRGEIERRQWKGCLYQAKHGRLAQVSSFKRVKASHRTGSHLYFGQFTCVQVFREREADAPMIGTMSCLSRT